MDTSGEWIPQKTAQDQSTLSISYCQVLRACSKDPMRPNQLDVRHHHVEEGASY